MLEKYFNDKFFEPIFTEKHFGNFKRISNDSEIGFQLPLVGIKKDNIKLSIDGNVIEIEIDENSNEWYGFQRRSFTFTGEVDLDRLNAKLEDGVLTVIAPKIDKKKKFIQIQ